MSALYKWINPPVKCLLKSRFHALMSSNTLLLEFVGRKSGRALSTPISYHLEGSTAHCFTNRSFVWWKNLTNGQAVTLTIAGKTIESVPSVITDDTETKEAALASFLRAVPRDAAHAGVQLDREGTPNAEDIQRVAPDMVYLKFPLSSGEPDDAALAARRE